MERYDYANQAWTVDGRYVRCGHQTDCGCYGRAHEGQQAPWAEAQEVRSVKPLGNGRYSAWGVGFRVEVKATWDRWNGWVMTIESSNAVLSEATVDAIKHEILEGI